MNKFKIIHWISTGLLTALMLFSSGMYIFNHEAIVGAFESLGYPSYIIYPLAIAKILGLVAIWAKPSKSLTEWAYAGFSFDVILALTAHLMANDGGHTFALCGIFFVLASYLSYKKLESPANGQ